MTLATTMLAFLLATAAPAAATSTAAPPPAPAKEEAPRVLYNRALEALEAKDADGALRDLTAARDRAGADAELRYRAAFNLGIAYALKADAAGAEKPEEAMAALRSAAAWFRDAVRLRRDDEDARVNLEVVLRRIQALADRLNARKGGLEARLDRLIDDERLLRDDVRALVARLDEEGAKAEPLAHEDAFRAAAAAQRALLAEAGAVATLAADEAGHLEAKPEAERSDEERVRVVQLRSLGAWLERARQRMADVRARLRKLDADGSHRATDAALRDLKRAREQLRDPIAVLRACLGDEVALLAEAEELAAAAKSAIAVGPEAPRRAAAWLTLTYLGERQADARERTDEVLARFRAATAGPLPEPPTGTSEVERRRRDRTIEAAREATPALEEAVAAMREAEAAFAGERAADAIAPGRRAAERLAAAIERFADIRGLVELAFADQTRVVALLTPPEPDAKDAKDEKDAKSALAEAAARAAATLSTEERAARVAEAVTRNADRLARMETLIQDELAALDEARSKSEGADAQAPDDAAARAHEEERRRYEAALRERKAAAEALDRLAAAIAAPLAEDAEDAAAPPALPPAKEALARIEALRRLFFSIVEHLRDLARAQADTRDETASAAARTDEAERANGLGAAARAQKRHEVMARAIADALAEAAKAPAKGPAAAERAKVLAQAGEETAAAASAMDAAATALADTKAPVDPALEKQKEALERLATAILLLDPPREQEQQPQQGEGQQQQGGERKEEDPGAMTREQAARRLQSIRDREAERRRANERRGQAAPEPVEKDW